MTHFIQNAAGTSAFALGYASNLFVNTHRETSSLIPVMGKSAGSGASPHVFVDKESPDGSLY